MFEGAVKSWLFLREPGRELVRVGLEGSALPSGRPSLDARREDEGRATLDASKSRRATLVKAAGLAEGGPS
jgi:hypothetical protein